MLNHLEKKCLLIGANFNQFQGKMSSRVIRSHSKGSSKSKPLSPYLNTVYDQLNEQIDRILGDFTPTAKVTISYQKLYKFVEFLCRDKMQSKIAATLFEKLDAFINKIADIIYQAYWDLGHDELVGRFVELATIIDVKVTALEKIHLYLDRTYLLNHPTKKTIVRHAMCTFVESCAGVDNGNGDEYKKDVLYQVVMEFTFILGKLRDGNLHVEPLLLRSYHYLHKIFYLTQRNDYLDNEIFSRQEDFYQEEQDAIITCRDTSPELPDFIVARCDSADEIFDTMYKMILRELQFWGKTDADDKFKLKIKEYAVENLIFHDFDKQAVQFVKPLFVSKNYLGVSRMFKFVINSSTSISSNKYLKTFLNIWYSYVCDYLHLLLKDTQQDMVEKLIKAKKNLTLIMQKYMDSNSEVEFKLREAFRTSLHSSNKDTEILSKLLKYIDNFFKTVDPSNTEDNLKVVDDLYLIFKSVKTKATFIKQYQRDLSRRLIIGVSKDKDLEKSLISKIRNEVGDEDSKPLLTMFDDLQINETVASSFKEKLSTVEANSFTGFDPLVLNSKAWPIPKASIKIPDEMNDLMTRFQKFYLETHDKRKLNWCPALSHMTIGAHFPKGDKELQVSSFQGIVLLLFNDHDKLSFNEVKEMTELDSKSLSSILYSLTSGRYKILKKDSAGIYSMNDEFEDRKKSIKVKQIQMKLKNGEDEDVWMQEVDDNVFKADRDEITKAFIVREMKSEKEMDHDVLMKKTVDRFVVESAEVKRIIQLLLDSEYIERIETDRYRYIP